MSRVPAFVFLVMSSATLAASAQDPAVPLLPQTFAGWTKTGAPSAAANPANAPVLAEYGLARTATATYSEGAGQLTVTALEFKDATGAYGAFTFYRQPQMHVEAIGREGAASGEHFVFWNNATVIDATFAKPAKDAASSLTTLSGLLPKAPPGSGVPPTLPHYLPGAGLNAESVRYAIGPAAYAAMGGTLPAAAIDFSLDAEVISAQYGPDTLTLVMYPTPQMAQAHLKAIESAQQGQATGGLARRSGPLLAVVNGSNRNLLDAVHFNDYVTINHPEGYVSEGAKLYHLLYGITVLTMVLVMAAVLLGFFLGGGRAVVRVLRGKSASSLSEEEFISLHLGN